MNIIITPQNITGQILKPTLKLIINSYILKWFYKNN